MMIIVHNRNCTIKHEYYECEIQYVNQRILKIIIKLNLLTKAHKLLTFVFKSKTILVSALA